jgi:Reverse transcriptase (RNA-dependent DNA polymerase)
LQLWGADVSSAYLEATTKEKVYFVAGDEFGDKCGHTLVINKALYGLRTSGLRWHERFADILRNIGFFQSRGEPDIWMRKNDNIYEYIGVYVDDLAIAAIDPESIVNALKEKHGLKLKGVGPMHFHLGCDFQRDKDGTLGFGPKSYISKMLENYERTFGEKAKKYSSPLEKNDHPELDVSEFLDHEGINLYQSMIGAAQWAVSLGRFDIQTAIMSMSHFRIAPRKGHLDRLKRIYGYLKRFKDGFIRVRTDIPDISNFPEVEQDWLYTVYGRVQEVVPVDTPEPLGNSVVLTHYTDANLMHDLTTGRAVTGVLHFINNTPIDWYSKRQATVETATYGAEFVAARIATDQIIDLRLTLRYLGVPISGKSHLFGDSASVIASSAIPHSSQKKRHNALSYHRVREAIAAKILYFHKIDGKLNYSDILSKHTGYQQAYPILKLLLFW